LSEEGLNAECRKEECDNYYLFLLHRVVLGILHFPVAVLVADKFSFDHKPNRLKEVLGRVSSGRRPLGSCGGESSGGGLLLVVVKCLHT
jgi:hypothetical protein